jgi:glutamate synthase domain-containing protein 3
MKAYEGFYPVIIAGGTAQDFLGEYMAGGLIIILGLDADPKRPIVGNYCGTGMHAGTIYLRGDVEDYQLGKEVKAFSLNEADQKILKTYVEEFASDFSFDAGEILNRPFCKLIPYTHRPYGKLYAY